MPELDPAMPAGPVSTRREYAAPIEFKGRLAEIQAEVDARNAAEAADPSLLWRRLGASAARDAVLAERLVPAEGISAFREAFDEALPKVREEDPVRRSSGTVPS